MSKHHNAFQTLEVLSVFGIFILFVFFFVCNFFLANIVVIVGDDEHKVNSACAGNIVVRFDVLKGHLLCF